MNDQDRETPKPQTMLIRGVSVAVYNAEEGLSSTNYCEWVRKQCGTIMVMHNDDTNVLDFACVKPVSPA